MDTSLFHGNMVTARRIIYTPSVFAKNTLLYLQETGALQARKPHTSARKNLPSFLFFIVRSGEGTLTFQGNTYALRRGDCIFLDCSEGYSHTTSENLWELEWVHFSGRTMREIYGKYMERGGSPVFHPDTLDAYLGCLSSLYALAASEDYIRDMRINEKLSALLSLIMEESWHPENAAGKQQILSDESFPRAVRRQYRFVSASCADHEGQAAATVFWQNCRGNQQHGRHFRRELLFAPVPEN